MCPPLMPLLTPRQPSLALDSAHPWRNDEVDDGSSVGIPTQERGNEKNLIYAVSYIFESRYLPVSLWANSGNKS